jgi:hypothetical protein
MSGEHKVLDKVQNGIGRSTKRVILVGGVILLFFGLVFLGMELWRTFTGLQGIRWKYLAIAMGQTFLGFLIVQTLNPIKVFEMAKDAYYYRKGAIIGARRWNDPPLETAPPPKPPEEWPPIPLREPGAYVERRAPTKPPEKREPPTDEEKADIQRQVREGGWTHEGGWPSRLRDEEDC